ncbi:MAG: hypothetical protein K2Y12_09880 [Chitinophagaceae bacterium]|nr:hypothetical protein [Chitinophagaceae bacterium]
MVQYKNDYKGWSSTLKGIFKSFIEKKWAPLAIIFFGVLINTFFCNEQSIISTPSQEVKTESENNKYPVDPDGNYIFNPADNRCNQLVAYIKAGMNDAESFEHVSTQVWHPNMNGEYTVEMNYRAKNVYGAYQLFMVIAYVDSATGNLTRVNDPKPVGR